MAELDTPIQLKFNNGNMFPMNFRYMAYVFMIGAVAIMILQSAYILGAVLLLMSIGVVTNQDYVVISEEDAMIHDYSLYFGFIKIGRKHSTRSYKYVTAMPLIETNQAMANYVQTTTQSKSSFTVTLFGTRLQGKKMIAKFNSREEAKEKATIIADRLNLKYFDYDPKLVRDVLTGKRKL
jgi:hypothetical protein